VRTRSPYRWTAVPAAALAALIALAGCGSSADPSPGGATPSATPAAGSANGLLPAAEGTTKYPLTLKSPWGETVLKKRPERVAVIGYTNDLENTLALGVTPVWADGTQAEYPWVPAAEIKKIEKLGELGDAFPFEDIAATEPDLIVAVQTDPDQLKDSYQRLSSFAPVLTTEAPGFDAAWEDVVRAVGSALDLTKRADEVVAGVESKITETAAAKPQYKGKSLSFLLFLQGNNKWTYRSFEGSPNAAIIQKLGFTLPPAASKFDRENIFISAENYGLLEADALLIASPKKELDAILKVPTFANVPVVAGKRYGVLDLDVDTDLGWATSWPTALNVPWFVDKIQPALDEATK
jgi:iron complex transport system substrate-binding protein